MITLKSKDEIRLMAHSGAIACFALNEVVKHVKAGVTTKELDVIAQRLIESRGATCAFLGFEGYGFATCISINNEVVHGQPSSRRLKSGDIVSIDLGAKYEGYYSDTARTVSVGKPKQEVQNLIQGVQEALKSSIQAARPGATVGDLEAASGATLKKFDLSPVLALSGHGIGKGLHEEPSIKSDGIAKTGLVLKEGMTLAVEPMATIGSSEIKVASDGWTVRTKDGSLSAHFEHTIVVTKTGARLLTAKC
jgi:methionyl aminopeptidase